MTKNELAAWLSRSRELFPLGAENVSVWSAFTQRLAALDYERAIKALESYAVASSGPGRKFVPGIYSEHLERVPDRADNARAHAESAQRVAREVARGAAAQRIKDERDADRRTVATANPLHVGEIVDELVAWGAPRPPLRPEEWPWPWTLAVADILTDRVRAAPTEAGYYEQVRADHGGWVDDPTKPLRPLPAREWWRVYGVAGLAARGFLPVG